MISVIIPTRDSAAYLARALAPLIPAVADGLVKEAVIVDGGSHDSTLDIAEEAGCTVLRAPAGRAGQMRAGAEAARGAWLLFLWPEMMLDATWIATADSFVARGPMRAAAFRFALDDESGGARRLAAWVNLRASLLKTPRGDQGLLISRTFYDALGGHSDMTRDEGVDLARRIGRERLFLLNAHVTMSGEKFRSEGYRPRVR